MKTMAMAAIFVVMALAMPARAINCERECAKRPNSARCKACGEIRTLRTGHLEADQGKELTDKLRGMPPEELEKWGREYARRLRVWDEKCARVPQDDPNLVRIMDECKSNKGSVSGKIALIERELKERGGAEAAARQCAQPERLTDAEYCGYACGKCNAIGQPLDRLKARAEAADKEDRKRAATRKKKAPKKEANTSFEGCLQAKCASYKCMADEPAAKCADRCRRVNASLCRAQHEMDQRTFRY